jgi:hypothetical protein
MRKKLHNVLRYFSYFAYAPSEHDIYTFFPVRITKKALSILLINEYKRGALLRIRNNNKFSLSIGSITSYLQPPRPFHYTLPQYSIPTSPRLRRVNKIQIKNRNRTIQIYISILKRLPLVRLVGITGKSAVEGVRENDDIDLFIVAQKNLIWTTRFLVVLLAKLFGVHGGSGVCLNLFFDEQNLAIPEKKQNEYIAHELLQMKPIVDKGSIYSALLEANTWILSYFPNARGYVRTQKTEYRRQNNMFLSLFFLILYSIFFLLDPLMRLVQLPIIKKNKTAFRITSTQLWLFKRDFERSLRKKIQI